MTKSNKDRNVQRATLRDLLVLHRYARSRLPGDRLSANEFVRRDRAENLSDPCRTKDVFKASIAKLEAEFDLNILKKRLRIGGSEVDKDLLYPEDFGNFEAAVLPLPSKEEHDAAMGSISFANKAVLTLDGEILGEVASLVAGYLYLARQATGRENLIPPGTDKRSKLTENTGRVRPGDEDRPGRKRASERLLFLTYLRQERRRLHEIVSAAKGEGGSVFELHRLLPDDVPATHPSDTKKLDGDRQD